MRLTRLKFTREARHEQHLVAQAFHCMLLEFVDLAEPMRKNSKQAWPKLIDIVRAWLTPFLQLCGPVCIHATLPNPGV